MKPVKLYPPKTIIREVPLELFPCHAYIMVTTDLANIIPNLNKHIKLKHNTTPPIQAVPSQDHCAFSVIKNGVSYMVLPIPTIPDNYHDDLRSMVNICRIIAHEAVHLTANITHYTDIKYDGNNDEPFAYINGHVAKIAAKTLIEFCKQNKIPITL